MLNLPGLCKLAGMSKQDRQDRNRPLATLSNAQWSGFSLRSLPDRQAVWPKHEYLLSQTRNQERHVQAETHESMLSRLINFVTADCLRADKELGRKDSVAAGRRHEHALES